MSEPAYRATNLWKELALTFTNHMPTGQRRKRLKFHEDCFVASEAIDWMHKHLCMKPNFNKNVTREQTRKLLDKFYQNNYFECVGKKKVNSFEDNTCLFRFTDPSCYLDTVLSENASKLPHRSPKIRIPLSQKNKLAKDNVISSSEVSSTDDSDLHGDNLPTDILPPVDMTIMHHALYSDFDIYRHSIVCESISDGNIHRLNSSLNPNHANVNPEEIGGPSKNYHRRDKLLPSHSDYFLSKSNEFSLKTNHRCQTNPFDSDEFLDSDIYLECILERLGELLQYKIFDDVLDVSPLMSKYVQYNLTNITHQGLVKSLPESDMAYTTSVLRMMKCLSKWPQYSAPYKGFEKDVFNNIIQHFYAFTSPIIPFDLYENFVNLLIYFDNISTVLNGPNEPVSFDLGMTSQNSADISHLSTSCAEIVANLSGQNASRLELSSADQHKQRRNRYAKHKLNATSRDRSYARALSADRKAQHFKSPLPISQTCGSFIGRCPSLQLSNNSDLNPRSNVTSNYQNANRSVADSSHSYQTLYACQQGSLSNSMITGSTVEGRYGPVTQRINVSGAHMWKNAPLNSSSLMLRYALGRGTETNSPNRSDLRVGNASQDSVASSESPDNSTNMRRSASINDDEELKRKCFHSRVLSENDLHGFEELPENSLHKSFLKTNVKHMKTLKHLKRNFCSELDNSCTYEDGGSLNRFCDQKHGYHPAALIECLQLYLLFLPPQSRRCLHLLLRFMSLVSQNQQLVLDSEVSNFDILLYYLSPCILSKPPDPSTDRDWSASVDRDIFSEQLTAFLIRHYDEVMAQPDLIKTKIQNRIIEKKRLKLIHCKANSHSSCGPTIQNLNINSSHKSSKESKGNVFQKTFRKLKSLKHSDF